MWVLAQGHESDPPYRIYDFRENRYRNNVLEILKDYRGGLHLDKYNAYQKIDAKLTMLHKFRVYVFQSRKPHLSG